jgi:hypothetical protein
MARKASHQEDQYSPPSPEEWRLLQARVEAFASDKIISLRNSYLDAWNRFLNEKTALDAINEEADPSSAVPLAERKRIVDEQALAVGNLYEKIRDAIREELRVRRVSRRP